MKGSGKLDHFRANQFMSENFFFYRRSFLDPCPQERDELGLKQSYNILQFATWIKENFGFKLLSPDNVTWHSNANDGFSPPAELNGIAKFLSSPSADEISLTGDDSAWSNANASTRVSSTPARPPRRPQPPSQHWQARPYLSSDVTENADNDNPEWEVVQKLETNLVIDLDFVRV
jgi:hypothetical protein